MSLILSKFISRSEMLRRNHFYDSLKKKLESNCLDEDDFSYETESDEASRVPDGIREQPFDGMN
jgi:hypothetical protein